jgi:alkylation response protein AidB-like acyl-CoA dehydrogenase
LFFDNVKVPKENRLADEKMGFKIIMQELARERLAIGQSSYGIEKRVRSRETSHSIIEY